MNGYDKPISHIFVHLQCWSLKDEWFLQLLFGYKLPILYGPRRILNQILFLWVVYLILYIHDKAPKEVWHKHIKSMCVRGWEWFVQGWYLSNKIGNAFLVKFEFRIYALFWYLQKKKEKTKVLGKGGIPFKLGKILFFLREAKHLYFIWIFIFTISFFSSLFYLKLNLSKYLLWWDPSNVTTMNPSSWGKSVA